MIFENFSLIFLLSTIIICGTYSFLSYFHIARKFLDVPSERSIHKTAKPRTGGLGIFFNLILLSFFFIDGDEIKFYYYFLLLISLIFLVSLWDDIYSLSFLPKIITHVIAATLFSYLYFSSVNIIDFNYIYFFVIIFLIISSINLFNFIDGADGFVAGIFSCSILIFMFFIFLSQLPQSNNLLIFTSICFFSCIVFLYYNFFPSRIFLGDSGSTMLGFIFATVSIIGIDLRLWPYWFPVLLILPFLLDTGITLLKRIYKKQKIWLAHKEHYYQRMLLMGMSHTKLSILSYCYVLIAGMLGLVLDSFNNFKITVITFIFLCFTFSMLMFFIDKKWPAK